MKRVHEAFLTSLGEVIKNILVLITSEVNCLRFFLFIVLVSEKMHTLKTFKHGTVYIREHSLFYHRFLRFYRYGY